MTILLDSDGDWDSSGAAWSALAHDALHAALEQSAHPDLAADGRHVEVSLALTTDETVHALNREWRDKDKPTNVLSFPMATPEDFPGAQPLMLGDIALAYETCAREAADKAIPLDQHARHLMVHGMLHLLGYDHQDDQSAEDMEARETRALASLGFPDPYGDRN